MKKPPQADNVKHLSSDSIRRKFNESQVPRMIANGKLRPHYLRDKQLEDPENRKHPEPPGTRSQTIRYSDSNGQWVVVVHQYLRPDGTLGASGKPDPKRLRIRNTVFIARQQ